MNDKELMSFAIARSNDPIIKNSVLRDALAMDLGPRRNYADGLKVDPLADSGRKISQVLRAYKRYRRGEKNPKINFNKFFEIWARENFDDGGKVVVTEHLFKVTGNPQHKGIYRITNNNSGSVNYRGGYTRKEAGGRKSTKSSPTIKGARELLNKALKIPKGKTMIDLQAEKGAGNLLNDKKFMTQLEKAFEEVSALEKKGYGNIDKIVKKYEKKFYVKPGSKTISGSTVQKGTDNIFTKTLRSEIREYAKELDIYGIENPNMEKALNDYRKIKNPKKGMIGNIAERYGLTRTTLDGYISKLGQRKRIPIQDADAYTKAIRAAEKKAIEKFSDSYFERKLSAPVTTGTYFADAADDEIVRLQKSHRGDKLTQDVKTSNIGYAAQEINQEVLKDLDTELRQINKDLKKLYKNKPSGYLKEMERLNQRGTDLAAASKGYKEFEGTDPYTGKKFVIPFSSASQELDPGNLLGDDFNLADVGKENKKIVMDLKEQAIKNASKTKAQVAADIKQIKKNLADLNDAEQTRLASMGGKGCNGNFAPGGPVPNKIKCIRKAIDRLKEPNKLGPADKANARKLFQSAGAKKFGNFLRGFGIPGEIVFESAFAIPAYLSGESGKRILGDTLLGFIGAGQSADEEFDEYAKKKGLSNSQIQQIRDIRRMVELGTSLNTKDVIGRESTDKLGPRGMPNKYLQQVRELDTLYDKVVMDQPQAKQQLNSSLLAEILDTGKEIDMDIQTDRDQRIKERIDSGIIQDDITVGDRRGYEGIMGLYKK